MQAVILAAGEGKRVRPLTRSRPKAMIPVANRPIIEYVIEALLKNGIREIIVVVRVPERTGDTVPEPAGCSDRGSCPGTSNWERGTPCCLLNPEYGIISSCFPGTIISIHHLSPVSRISRMRCW